MKKILYSIFIIALAIGLVSCSDDYLETGPTDSAQRGEMFETTDGAQAAMNGVYRLLYVAGWSVGNEHQNFGIMSTKLYTSLMGEDMVQDAMGSGWFYFDYRFDVNSRYTSAAWRPYATWNFYYTLISNVNYILAEEETLEGDPEVVDNIMAQAYAMRAYAYFQLIQSYQQTYKGNESAPGVPVYTEPTLYTTVGKGRGTVEEVYTQINSDLDAAIEKFSANKGSQDHSSNMDYYVANAIKANVALVQNKWDVAAKHARAALSKPRLAFLEGDDLYKGFNDASTNNVLWGAKIIADQSTAFASFFSHMDPRGEKYAESSRKCIYNWLYNRIPNEDLRKKWWNGTTWDGDESEAGEAWTLPFSQQKFKYSNTSTDEGDYIFLRAEEMQLVLAEALCHDRKYTEAKDALLELLELRYNDDYDLDEHPVHKAEMSNENRMGSIGEPQTLMDHILLQRRIELWGEAERIFDLQRLKMGFDRTAPNSNHSQQNVGFDTTRPAANKFILAIPQKEFDGNPNMGPEDQNPM